MENLETDNYLVKVNGNGYRIIDKCQHLQTPVDGLDGYKTIKDAYDMKPAIFNTVCESLIKVSGQSI